MPSFAEFWTVYFFLLLMLIVGGQEVYYRVKRFRRQRRNELKDRRESCLHLFGVEPIPSDPAARAAVAQKLQEIESLITGIDAAVSAHIEKYGTISDSDLELALKSRSKSEKILQYYSDHAVKFGFRVEEMIVT